MTRTEKERVICFTLMVVLLILTTLALGRTEAPIPDTYQLPTISIGEQP